MFGVSKNSQKVAPKNPFSSQDPEQVFTDLYQIGHGNFGAVYYVSNNIILSNNILMLLC